MVLKGRYLCTEDISSIGLSLSIPGCLSEKLNPRLLLCSKKSCIDLL